MEGKEKIFTTFRHIRSGDEWDPVYLGAVTACCEVDPENLTMQVGLAFCSPNETHFNRRRGRLIAAGRLKSKPVKIPFVNNSLVGSILGYLEEQLILEEKFLSASQSEYPQWVSTFVADQLSQHKMRTAFSLRDH